MGPAYSETKKKLIRRCHKIPKKKNGGNPLIIFRSHINCVFLAAYSGGVKCSPILCTVGFKSVEEKGIKTRCYAIGNP